MTLELPACAERFIPEGESFDHLHSAGVYALELSRPDDLEKAWDREYDNRPPYFEELQKAEKCLYVGESEDVLHRLEQHAAGEIKVGVLQRVCEIDGLRNIWWCESKEHAEQQESQLAIALQNQYPSYYVHQR